MRSTSSAAVAAAAFLGAVLLSPIPAAGQPPGGTTSAPARPRVEVFGGWAVATPESGGTLTGGYAPPLLLGGTPLESSSRQTLAVDAGTGHGFDAGVNVFLTRHLGIQAAFTWWRSSVSGENADYDLLLRYIARQPPAYLPAEYVYERSNPSGDTTGTLDQKSVAVGGVARWRVARDRVGGTVAAGASFDRYAGEMESLVFTQFVLGGHSTLFPVHHRVVMSPGSGVSWGPYVAGDVHVHLAGPVALLARVRASLGSRVSTPARAERLVDPGENPWTPELSTVREHLDGQPLELPGTRWNVVFGVVLRK